MEGKVVKYPSRLKKKSGKKMIFWLFVRFILAGVCLCLGQTLAIWQARSELRELEGQRNALLEENELLKEERLLLHDKEYLEIQARKQLGMVRPGELLFFIGD